jgi:hypothetical protein
LEASLRHVSEQYLRLALAFLGIAAPQRVQVLAGMACLLGTAGCG